MMTVSRNRAVGNGTAATNGIQMRQILFRIWLERPWAGWTEVPGEVPHLGACWVLLAVAAVYTLIHWTFGKRELLRDPGIVRHRGKIVSTINNACRAIELVEEAGSLAAFFWSFEPGPQERPQKVTWAAVAAMPKTETSTRISRELKKRGWTFVGPTTVYAFMQAMGMVNDHIEGCVCREEVEAARRKLTRPAPRP